MIEGDHMYKIKKTILLILTTASILLNGFQCYAVEPVTIHNTNISAQTDLEFVSNMNNNNTQFIISEMNSNNKWYIMDRILYKYYPEAYFQDWYYQYDTSGLRIVDIYKNSAGYLLNLSQEFYNRITVNDNSEYNAFIDYLIAAAGVSDNTNQDTAVRNVVNVLKAYPYDDITYINLLNSGIPGYKIVRDYGITMCHSDSKLFKACMDRLGIPCRIIENSSHGWNQVLVNGSWVGVDVSYERKTSSPGKYIYFNDSSRPVIQVFE